MTTVRTSAEIKAEAVARMGEQLGLRYHALRDELSLLHAYWNEFVVLFGTKASRIELLNAAAPAFFGRLQDELWESTLLNLARLTDPIQTAGKLNLTIQCLPPLITEATTKDKVQKLVDEAIASTSFCRDWRNRRIAHRDLAIAIEQPNAKDLESGSRQQVKEALMVLQNVLNTVENRFLNSQTAYQAVSHQDDAIILLRVIADGLKARDKLNARLAAGGMPDDDDYTNVNL